VQSECITYDKGNGKFETTCNPPEPISPSKMVTNDSTPSCFKVNLIVFYDNHFRDSTAAPLDPAVRVQQVLDLTQSTNTFGFSPYFSGLGIDIQLNTVAIDHYNGTYVASDNSMLRTTVANPDTRNTNIWIFLTAALGAGHVGSSDPNDPCGSTKSVGTFVAYTTDDAALAGVLGTHIGLLLAQNYPFSDYYNENQPFCLETCSDNVNNCTDWGCSYQFSELGECVDITNPNWKALNNMYDLSQTANIYGIPHRQTPYGLCGASLDDSCCRCMKKKTCKDTGCKKRFGGNGVCIDAVDGDLSKYDLDFDVNPDQTPGLCTNDVNENCCSCFKKQDSDSGCYKVRCYVGKVEGICVGSNDPYPLEYIKTDQRCEEKGDCQCFIPCRDIWKQKKCRNYARKGKCEEAITAAKCCATCKNY